MLKPTSLLHLTLIATVLVIASGCQDTQPEQSSSPIPPESSPSSSNPTTPVASNEKYFCGQNSEGTPTTYFRKATGKKVAIIRWERDNWQNVTPQERCEEVSTRFSKSHEAGKLFHLTHGPVNEQPVICGVISFGDACNETNMLITLQHQDDSRKILEELQQFGSGADGPIPNTEDGSPQIYIDLTKLINFAPEE